MKISNFSKWLVLIVLLGSCEDQGIFDPDYSTDAEIYKSERASTVFMATGEVEILWKGADKGSDSGNKPDSLLPFLRLNAHMGNDYVNPKGDIEYYVLNPDSTAHRIVRAEVTGVHIDPIQHKAWVVGEVIYDSKGCAGDGSGGHDPGCSHDDGGCSHDDGTHDDGGCSHDDGTPDDGSHDDGCSHDDGGDSGCGGSDHGGMGGPGSSGSDGKGNPLSGKNCRLGQVIALKMHDGGTPGTNGDGITWKWFSSEADFVPAIENIVLWPHLCKKTIINGNLVIHL